MTYFSDHFIGFDIFIVMEVKYYGLQILVLEMNVSDVTCWKGFLLSSSRERNEAVSERQREGGRRREEEGSVCVCWLAG